MIEKVIIDDMVKTCVWDDGWFVTMNKSGKDYWNALMPYKDNFAGIRVINTDDTYGYVIKSMEISGTNMTLDLGSGVTFMINSQGEVTSKGSDLRIGTDGDLIRFILKEEEKPDIPLPPNAKILIEDKVTKVNFHDGRATLPTTCSTSLEKSTTDYVNALNDYKDKITKIKVTDGKNIYPITSGGVYAGIRVLLEIKKGDNVFSFGAHPAQAVSIGNTSNLNFANVGDTIKFFIVETPPLEEKYNITIDEMVDGSVSSNVFAATEGMNVILSVKPNSGFELDSLEAMDSESKPVQLMGYQFKMPADNVTVKATFKKHYPISVIRMASPCEYAGLSMATKPTQNIPVHSLFLELDTGKIYYFDGETWSQAPESITWYPC